MRLPGRRRTPSPPPPTFTVFLDRDGVLNPHPRTVVRRWRDFVWLPGARDAMARLNRPGIRVCLATNQPTVGMGITTRVAIERLHAALVEDIVAAGGRLDRVEASYPIISRRRKPRPGMLEDAAEAFAAAGDPVDKERAVMVGDRLKDAQAAHAFGIPAILVATTHPRASLQEQVARAGLGQVCIVADLAEAVDEVLSRVEEAGDEA